jgi:hypothetical protein
LPLTASGDRCEARLFAGSYTFRYFSLCLCPFAFIGKLSLGVQLFNVHAHRAAQRLIGVAFALAHFLFQFLRFTDRSKALID